jgi:ArsR family transcriptional regulator
MSTAVEIPEPIRCDIEKLGGINALADGIPDKNRLEALGKMFKGVSDKYRLQILLILNKQPVCVCIIKEILKISDSKLSYHLAALKDNKLIYGEQQGNWIIYYPTGLGRTISDLILTKFL